MFLPDRFIKGECPKCHAKDQYGDSCEACGATYSPTELINPYSAVSGATPVTQEIRTLFLQARQCDAISCRTGRADHLQSEAANKMQEWIGSAACTTGTSRATRPTSASKFPARRASISTSGWTHRSATWPASRTCATRHGHGLRRDSGTRIPSAELYHFIGKDILYFHALFWPAMLEHAGYAHARPAFSPTASSP